jgi:hypothetical protein
MSAATGLRKLSRRLVLTDRRIGPLMPLRLARTKLQALGHDYHRSREAFLREAVATNDYPPPDAWLARLGALNEHYDVVEHLEAREAAYVEDLRVRSRLVVNSIPPCPCPYPRPRAEELPPLASSEPIALERAPRAPSLSVHIANPGPAAP